MFFSAKELLTKSASQMKFLLDNPSKRQMPTQSMHNGCEFQNSICKKIPNVIGQELGGTVKIGNNFISFSNDIVCNDKIIEVKNILGETSDWYLKNSLLQCAAYKTLVNCLNGELRTAKFYEKLGNKSIYTQIDCNIPYYLLFGNQYYIIYNVKYDMFLRFFELKINSILKTYAECKNFDSKFKHNEFELLKPYFNFKLI